MHVAALLLIFAPVFLLPSANAAAEAISGHATVINGDTLQIRDQQVRLHGVDAPARAEPWGSEAAERLTSLTEGLTVTCEPTGANKGDLIVARCYAGARDLAEVLVIEGVAFPSPSYTSEYEAAEAQAQHKGAGAWPTGKGYLDYVAAWGPFAGAFLGALALVAAAWAAYYFNRRHRLELTETERQNLAGAFLGEISALRMIAERRAYLGHVKESISTLEKLQEIPILDHSVSVKASQNYFTVYEANASKMGILPPPLPQQIAELYAVLRSALDDLIHMDDIVRRPHQQVLTALRDLKELMQDALVLAEHLELHLEAVALGQHLPRDYYDEVSDDSS